MLRTQIYIPEYLHQQLFFLSKKENVSMAELIRQFVEIGVKTKARKKSSGRILLELAASPFKGLPKDVSLKHNEYLYGKRS